MRSLLFFISGAFLFALFPAIHAEPFQGACGKLVLPATPTNVGKTFIRKGFGEFDAPRKGGESTHKGVDITRNSSDSDLNSTAVFSVAAGSIAYSRVNGSSTDGYGNVVVVDHGNGCYSMYAHLASKPFTPAKPGGNLEVSLGAKVAVGQRIGYFVDIKSDSDSTGNAVRTDPAARSQVHFQLIEAPSGRSSATALAAITRADGMVVDPTPFLTKLGYKTQ